MESSSPKSRPKPPVPRKPAIAAKPKLHIDVSRALKEGNNGNVASGSRSPPPRPSRPAAGAPGKPCGQPTAVTSGPATTPSRPSRPAVGPPSHQTQEPSEKVITPTGKPDTSTQASTSPSVQSPTGPPKPPRSPASTLITGFSLPPETNTLSSPLKEGSDSSRNNSESGSHSNLVKELANKLSANIKLDVVNKRKDIDVAGSTQLKTESKVVEKSMKSSSPPKEEVVNAVRKTPPRPAPRKRPNPLSDVKIDNAKQMPKTEEAKLVDSKTQNIEDEETAPHAPPRTKRKSPVKQVKESKTNVVDNSCPMPAKSDKLPKKKPPPTAPKPLLRTRSKSLENIFDAPSGKSTNVKAMTLNTVCNRSSRSLGSIFDKFQQEDNSVKDKPETDDKGMAVENETVQPIKKGDIKEGSEDDSKIDQKNKTPEIELPPLDEPDTITEQDVVTTCVEDAPRPSPQPRRRSKVAPPEPPEPQSTEETPSEQEQESMTNFEIDNQRTRTASVPAISLSGGVEHLSVKPRSDSQSSSSSEGKKAHKTEKNILRKGSKLLSQFKQSLYRKTSSSSDHSSKHSSSMFYCDVHEDDGMVDVESESDRPLSIVSVFSESEEKTKPLPVRSAPLPPGTKSSAESNVDGINKPEADVTTRRESIKSADMTTDTGVCQLPQEKNEDDDIDNTKPVSPQKSDTDESIAMKTENSKSFKKVLRPARPAPPPPAGPVEAAPLDKIMKNECDAIVTENTKTFEKSSTPGRDRGNRSSGKSESSTPDRDRGSRGSGKSEKSLRTRKKGSGRKSMKYDSMGYLKSCSNSDGDLDDGHCYADIDSSDDERKPRSYSDTSLLSGSSGHIYEAVDTGAYQLSTDGDIYQDISEESESEPVDHEPNSPELFDPCLSPPEPPPRNKRVKVLANTNRGQALSSDTNSDDASAVLDDDNDSDDYVVPEQMEEDSDWSDDDCDSYMVSPTMRAMSGRHSIRECDYIDMSGRTFSSENLLASLEEDIIGHSPSDNTTTDHASSSDEQSNVGVQNEDEVRPAPKKSKIFYIAEEIMTSEKIFVDVLHLLNVDFRHAIDDATAEMDSPVIPASQVNKILNYLPQLQRFSQELLSDLTHRIQHWEEDPRVADIFVQKGPFLKLYTSYIKDYNNTTVALEEACKKYPHFEEVVKKFQMTDRCAKLNLEHYMLKPIQRIPQYKMLLHSYQDKLPPDSPDLEDTKKALCIVSEVADHANEAMHWGDNQRKLLLVQERLLGDFEVVQPGRVIIREGDLKKLSRKDMQPRRFFLFNDVLLHTTPMTIGAYKINNKLSLAGMKVLKPVQEDFESEFSIISVQRSFTLAASSPEERDAWISDLNSAIKEYVLKKTTFKSKLHTLGVPEQDKDFILGCKAPVWIPDARVTMCMVCTAEFTVTFRRHHCRACGKVVCGQCSDYKAPLQYLKYKQNRVCVDCFDKLQEVLDEQPPPDSPGGTSSAMSSGNLRDQFVNKGLRKSALKSKKRPAVLQEVCANDTGADMSGYMKEFVKAKKWKKLWFVLKQKVLYTYRASEDTAAIESLPLLGYEIETFKEYLDGVEPSLLLQISHQGRPPRILRTESPTAVEKWMQVFKEATIP